MRRPVIAVGALVAVAAIAALIAHPYPGCEIGTRMPDRTVCAGFSPTTGRSMYALPADAPLTMTWQKAIDYAANFEGHGHPKGAFRLPTSAELNVLFENRAKIGAFNEAASDSAGWYWSSTEHRDLESYACDQRFSDGLRDCHHKSNVSSLRLVRS